MTVIADDHISRLDGSATGGAEGARGIVVGSSEGFAGRVDGRLDVLQERLGSLGVPVLGGLGVGHDVVGLDESPDHAVVLGAPAPRHRSRDADSRTVRPLITSRWCSGGVRELHRSGEVSVDG